MDIVLINLWESVDAATEAANFCAVWGIEGDVLLDETGEFAQRIGIRGVPTNVMVDEEGIVRTLGATTPRELRAAIVDLLGTSEW